MCNGIDIWYKYIYTANTRSSSLSTQSPRTIAMPMTSLADMREWVNTYKSWNVDDFNIEALPVDTIQITRVSEPEYYHGVQKFMALPSS